MVNEKLRGMTAQLRRGRYAWPGGYPLFLVCSDGAALCWTCVEAERSSIWRSTALDLADGWRAEGFDVNWEATMPCDHCGEDIESAYGDPPREALPR